MKGEISLVSNSPILAELPESLKKLGNNAKFAWDEFFNGVIANENTRRSYKRSVIAFLNYIESRELELTHVIAGHIREYFNSLSISLSSKKQALSALRHFFDKLVERHVILLNPTSPIRLERMVYDIGKTKPIMPEDVKAIIASIDIKNVSDLRDRCILGILCFMGCRISALRNLDFDDYKTINFNSFLILKEKGGKIRQMPLNVQLKEWLNDYVNFAAIEDGPLFRNFKSRDIKRLSESGLNYILNKHLSKNGLGGFSAHSFRAGTATNLLEKYPLELVQRYLGHRDPRTTQLYDHRDKVISQSMVDSI